MNNDKKPSFWDILTRPQRLTVLAILAAVTIACLFFWHEGGREVAVFMAVIAVVVFLNAAFGEETRR